MYFKLKERIKYFFCEIKYDWEIGIYNNSIESFITDKEREKNIDWIPLPPNCFYADPFGIIHENKKYIFFEEFNYDQSYGLISYLVLNNDNQVLEKQIIIDEEIHFSFPQIIKYNNHIYIMPETCQKGKLSVYQAEEFPNKWKEKHTLLNLPCVDSVLFEKNRIWYLFYSNATIGNKCFLRTNDNPFENWESQTEIVINESDYNSRNGGEMLNYKNEIYRVTQNCTSSYGESIVLNKFNFQENHEEKFMELKMKGNFHTLNKLGTDKVLVDRRIEKLKPKSIGRILKTIKTKLIAK